MKFIPFYFALGFAAVISTGCTTPITADNSVVGQMSNCDKIEALVMEHSNEFKKVRSNLTATRKMDVWGVRHQLVGENCQVWGWSTGKFNYVCSLATPNKSSAMQHYETAKQLTRSCLNEQWSLSERPRKIGVGTKATFSKTGSNTVIAIQAVETNGLFSKDWTAYYSVGSPNDAI
jgi:hypothetical protein